MGQDRVVHADSVGKVLWASSEGGGSTNPAFRMTPTFATWALEWIKLGTVQQNFFGNS